MAAPNSPVNLDVTDADGDELVEAYSAFELEILHHNNSLADAKASFILGLAVAFAVAAFQPMVLAFHAHTYLRGVLGGLGEIAMIVSGVAAFLTVAPRIINSTAPSNTYWGSAAFRGPVDAYVEQIRALTADELSRATLTHLHLIARICRLKYTRLKIAFYAAPLGILFLGAAYLAGPTY